MAIDLAWIGQTFPDLTNVAALNHGGQKWVFGATHPIDGEVVLKLVKPANDPERVRREVIAAKKVKHPRVPAVCEIGLAKSNLGECLWIREKRVSGECLRSVLQRGSLKIPEVLKLGLHVLDVLVASADADLVHRDIKPDNIIVDNNGDFWVIDFGLARHLDMTSLTADQVPWGLGTCGYSAPEQMRNFKKQIDQRADLFATAVTIYECATGSNPFLAGTNSPLERLNKAESDPLPPLQLALPNGSSDSLRDLVSAMAQKRRDHRPATVKIAFDWMSDICTAEGVR